MSVFNGSNTTNRRRRILKANFAGDTNLGDAKYEAFGQETEPGDFLIRLLSGQMLSITGLLNEAQALMEEACSEETVSKNEAVK